MSVQYQKRRFPYSLICSLMVLFLYPAVPCRTTDLVPKMKRVLVGGGLCNSFVSHLIGNHHSGTPCQPQREGARGLTSQQWRGHKHFGVIWGWIQPQHHPLCAFTHHPGRSPHRDSIIQDRWGIWGSGPLGGYPIPWGFARGCLTP